MVVTETLPKVFPPVQVTIPPPPIVKAVFPDTVLKALALFKVMVVAALKTFEAVKLDVVMVMVDPVVVREKFPFSVVFNAVKIVGVKEPFALALVCVTLFRVKGPLLNPPLSKLPPVSEVFPVRAPKDIPPVPLLVRVMSSAKVLTPT